MLLPVPQSKSARKVTQNSNRRMAGKGYFKIQEIRMCCRHFKEKKKPQHKSPSVICTFTAPFKSPQKHLLLSFTTPLWGKIIPIKPISPSLILNSPRSGALSPAYFHLNIQLWYFIITMKVLLLHSQWWEIKHIKAESRWNFKPPFWLWPSEGKTFYQQRVRTQP